MATPSTWPGRAPRRPSSVPCWRWAGRRAAASTRQKPSCSEPAPTPEDGEPAGRALRPGGRVEDDAVGPDDVQRAGDEVRVGGDRVERGGERVGPARGDDAASSGANQARLRPYTVSDSRSAIAAGSEPSSSGWPGATRPRPTSRGSRSVAVPVTTRPRVRAGPVEARPATGRARPGAAHRQDLAGARGSRRSAAGRRSG